MSHFLATIPPLLLFLVVGGLIGAESIGLPLPGETALITALLLADADHVSLWLVAVAAVVGGLVGENVGYLIGWAFGERVLDWARRKFPRVIKTQAILRAAGLMERYGMWAVFGARFVSVLRIFANPLAGTLRMHYGRFIVASTVGLVVWVGLFAVAVAVLGPAARDVMRHASWVLLAVAVIIVAVIVVVWLVRRRRAKRYPAPALTPEQEAQPLKVLLAQATADAARRAPRPRQR